MTSKWLPMITDRDIRYHISRIKARHLSKLDGSLLRNKRLQRVVDKMPLPTVGEVRHVLEMDIINESSPTHEVCAAISITLVPDNFPGNITVGIEFEDEDEFVRRN